MQFTHYNQPYGYATFEVEKQEPCNYQHCVHFAGMAMYTHMPVCDGCRPFRDGWTRLEGVVVEGCVVSRLFQHTHTRDLKGTRYVLEVSPEDFAKRSCTNHTCG